jgi:hypothetical protein
MSETLVAPAVQATFLAADERLSKKALNATKGVPLVLTDEDVGRLEDVIDRARDEFAMSVKARLKGLRQALTALRSDATDPKAALLAEIKAAAYELKGLGSMFGYPILTTVASMLHGYLDRRSELLGRQAAVVGIHVDVLYVVIARKVTRMVRATENELLSSLALLATRFP